MNNVYFSRRENEKKHRSTPTEVQLGFATRLMMTQWLVRLELKNDKNTEGYKE